MNKLFSIAAAAAIIGGTSIDKAGACNLRSPIFEVTGFPISSHQVALLGGANVVEQSAVPTLMLNGMPASPHQIAVLTPRAKAPKVVQASADPSATTIGLAPSLLRSARAASSVACLPE